METKDYKELFSHNDIRELLRVWKIRCNELYCIASSHGSEDMVVEDYE